MPEAGTIGLILAGGRAIRMAGKNKALLTFAGKPLLTHAVTRLGAQVDALVLSSNAPAADFARFDLPVLPDVVADSQGPLAGIHAGLTHYPHDFVVSVAVDLPLLPSDLVARLRAAIDGYGCAYASDGQRHALAILWAPGSVNRVERYLDEGGRRMRDFLARHGTAVRFDRPGDRGLFVNINTPDDLLRAEQELAAEGPGRSLPPAGRSS
jgi:molybdopterin-guanine dinucleotide biosynthesis protein A